MSLDPHSQDDRDSHRLTWTRHAQGDDTAQKPHPEHERGIGDTCRNLGGCSEDARPDRHADDEPDRAPEAETPLETIDVGRLAIGHGGWPLGYAKHA